MKRPPTLTVTEFRQMIEAMCTDADSALSSTRARMDALRSETRPPG